jgi:hypothetical protein
MPLDPGRWSIYGRSFLDQLTIAIELPYWARINIVHDVQSPQSRKILMKSIARFTVVGLSAGLLLATPVLAQTKDAGNPATDVTKQKTQGAPAGFKPTTYGADAQKQQTAGGPAGMASKQQTAGAPVGFATKQQTAGAPVGYSTEKQQ